MGQPLFNGPLLNAPAAPSGGGGKPMFGGPPLNGASSTSVVRPPPLPRLKPPIIPGNIDLTNRKVLHNADGSISTEASISFEDKDGMETIIPTVADDGSRILPNHEAIQQYRRTGQHLGKFKDVNAAENWAQDIHEQQGNRYAQPQEQPADYGDFANSFMQSAGPQNMTLAGHTLMAIEEATGDNSLTTSGEDLIRRGQEMGKAVKPPSVTSLSQIGSLGDAWKFAEYGAGTGLGSMLAPMVGGIGGGALGSRLGKIGATVGALGGAYAGSNMLNIGSMRQTLLDEGVKDPVTRGKVAIAGGMAMSSLDTFVPGGLASRLTGGARKELEKAIVKRILQGAKAGAITEGLTEGTQQAIQDIVGKETADKPIDPWALIQDVADNAAAGVLGGGLAEGAVHGVTGPERQTAQPGPQGSSPEAVADFLRRAGATTAEDPYTQQARRTPSPGDRLLPQTVATETKAEPAGPIPSAPAAPPMTENTVTERPLPPLNKNAPPLPGLPPPGTAIENAPEQPSAGATSEVGSISMKDQSRVRVEPRFLPAPPEAAPEAAGPPSVIRMQGPIALPPAAGVPMFGKNDPVVTPSVSRGEPSAGIPQSVQEDKPNEVVTPPPAANNPQGISVAPPAPMFGKNDPVVAPTPQPVPAPPHQNLEIAPDFSNARDAAPQKPSPAKPVSVQPEKPVQAVSVPPASQPVQENAAPAAPQEVSGAIRQKQEKVERIKAHMAKGGMVTLTTHLKHFQLNRPELIRLGDNGTVYIATGRSKTGRGGYRWDALFDGQVEQLVRQTPQPSGTVQTVPETPTKSTPQPVVTAKKPRKAGKPQSLIQFLAASGGIKEQGGELKTLGLTNKFVPGAGRLVRAKGRSHDYARELAVEAGYLPRDATVADLLDALDREHNIGQPVYRAGDEGAAAEAAKPRKVDTEEALHHFHGETQTKEADYPTDIYARARQLIEKGHEPERAFEMAYAEAENAIGEPSGDAVEQDNADEVPFDAPSPAVERAAPESQRRDGPRPQEAAPGTGERSSAPRQGSEEAGAEGSYAEQLTRTASTINPAVKMPDGRAYRVKKEGNGYIAMRMGRGGLSGEPPTYMRRPQGGDWTLAQAVDHVIEVASKPAEEAGADGKPQTVLPGAEKASAAALAQRKADQPLKPKVEQKPAEHGLFGDGHKQADIFDLKMPSLTEPKGKAKPVFYSALLRALESAKQEKAAPAHWIGMLKNMPGVKPAEVEWLGLEEWLRSQPSPVTRQKIIDFVRANQVNVDEVVKGGKPVPAEAIDAIRNWLRNEFGEPDEQASVTEADLQRLQSTRDSHVLGDLEGLGVPAELLAPLHNAGNPGPTKFSQYTLPEGGSYRELLLTLPVKREYRPIPPMEDWLQEQPWFQSRPDSVNDHNKRILYKQWVEREKNGRNVPQFTFSHFDEPNILAHVRFNERTDAEGKRVLFIEEIQSDWHQKGRKQGYSTAEAKQRLDKAVAEMDALARDRDPVTNMMRDERRWHDLAHERDNLAAVSAVPDAPFKTTWPELALKRMIRWAAENGFDKVAWAPGDVQADRYDLSKQIDMVGYQKRGGIFNVTVWDKKGFQVFNNQSATPQLLEDTLGKEITQKIVNGEGRKEQNYTYLEGLDLKVGGEGMKGFYDKILVDTANKLGKKFGAKVGTTEIKIVRRHAMGRASGNGPTRATVPAIPITEAMRESVMEGQSLFMRHPGATSPRKPKPARRKSETHRLRHDIQALSHQILGHGVRITDLIRDPETGTPDHGMSGMFHRGVISIALNVGNKDKLFILRHEAVHALRDAGVFTEGEWDILTRAALRHPSMPPNRLQGYFEYYNNLGQLSPDQVQELLIEEIIADHIAGRAAEPLPPIPRRIIEKVRNFLQALFNMLRGYGFTSEADVVRAFERGDIARRGRGSGQERFARVMG